VLDRKWLVINPEDNVFYSGRNLFNVSSVSFPSHRKITALIFVAQLVLIEPRISGSNLAIHIPNRAEPVLVPIDPTPEQLAKFELVENVTIWDDTTDAYAVSEEADEALSEYFQKPARLVMKGPEGRPSQPMPDTDPLDYEDTVLNFQGESIRRIQTVRKKITCL
jgi:hypothetical protein